MAETLSITLRGNRTRAEMFADAALANGYKANVEVAALEPFKAPHDEFVKLGSYDAVLASNGVDFAAVKDTSIPGDGFVYISYTRLLPNPISADDFAKRLLAAVFDNYDLSNAAEAAKIRATQGVSDGSSFE